MNYSALVTDYIKQYEPCEPIFFDDVKKYLIDECNKDGEEIDALKLTNNLKTGMNGCNLIVNFDIDNKEILVPNSWTTFKFSKT